MTEAIVRSGQRIVNVDAPKRCTISSKGTSGMMRNQTVGRPGMQDRDKSTSDRGRRRGEKTWEVP